MARTGLYPDVHGNVVMSLRPSTRVQNVTYTATPGTSLPFLVVNQDTTYKETTAGGPASNVVGTTHVRLVSTTDCYVLINPGAVATATNGFLLPAGAAEYFPVDTLDVISVVQSTTAGSLNIAECN